jgi:hypothetical protein
MAVAPERKGVPRTAPVKMSAKIGKEKRCNARPTR